MSKRTKVDYVRIINIVSIVLVAAGLTITDYIGSQDGQTGISPELADNVYVGVVIFTLLVNVALAIYRGKTTTISFISIAVAILALMYMFINMSIQITF